ncbi:MAG: acyltransferase [Caulobacterales bacterium]|nr:acyltransferase [Caulobacterales bacterium]
MASSIILSPGAFRLLLALAVVIAHITALDIGHLAVLLFFYLSGYWVTRIWTEKFGEGRRGMFYASRYLRIFPLFLLATLISAWARETPLGLTNFTLFGLSITGHDPTLVSWSLDLEAQFYLLLPFVAVFFVTAPRQTLAVGLALTVAGFAMHERYGFGLAKFCLPFILGGLTYGQKWRPSERAALISLAGFVAFTALTAFTPFLLKTTPDPFSRDVWAILWLLPLLPYVANSLTIRSGAFDRDLGNLSFPVYLFHQVVIFGVVHSVAAGSRLEKPLIIGGTLALAAIIYRVFDRPIDAWRVRVTERRVTQAPPSSDRLDLLHTGTRTPSPVATVSASGELPRRSPRRMPSKARKTRSVETR